MLTAIVHLKQQKYNQLVTVRNMVDENVGINCKGGNVGIDNAAKISMCTS